MILSRMSRTYLVFTIIPKTIRTFSVQMMVLILFHIMDMVAGGCHLNMTAEALWSTFANSPTGPADGKPGEVWCPPGYVHYDDRTACSSVKEQATMPYWNSCRNGFSCEDWRCGEHEEEVSPCDKTHFPVCKSKSFTPTTTPFSGGTETLATTQEPVSCAYEPLYNILGFFGVVAVVELIIIIGLLLCRKKYSRINKNERYCEPSGRENVAAEYVIQRGYTERYCEPPGRVNDAEDMYSLQGNPAGTAVLIVNPDRGHIPPDIQLSKEIFKLLLGSKTSCKRIDATSVDDVKEKIQNLLTSGNLGDSFVCIILGHGTLDGLICQEDDNFLSMETLMSWLHGTQCREFLKKPKLFFSTCCRGGGSEGVTYVVESGGGSGPTSTVTAVSDTADILISYASSNGKPTYFDENGSVHLRMLKEALTKGKYKEDIYSILTAVSRKSKWNNLKKNNTEVKVHQQPVFHSTLTKKFYPVGDDSDNDSDDDDEDDDVETGPKTSTHATPNGNAVAYMPIDTDNDVTTVESHELDEVSGRSDGGNDDTHVNEGCEEGERDNVTADDVHTVLIHGASNSNTEPSKS